MSQNPISAQTILLPNQASELPESINTVIPTIKPLKTRKKLALWKQDIRATLSGCDLLDLINIDGLLQCPDIEDANYIKWRRLSTRVGQWLTGQVDEEFKQQLIDEQTNLRYADEIYTAIIRIISEQDPTATTDAFY